jgi:hypothetical protein
MNKLIVGWSLMAMISPCWAAQPESPEQNSLDEAHTQSDAEKTARFEALDVDHDGYISRSEALGESKVASDFINFDETQDDRLSPQEFAKLSSPTGVTIQVPVDLGTGKVPTIEIKPATQPQDAGPDIAP